MYWSSAYYVSGTVLSPGQAAVNHAEQVLDLTALILLMSLLGKQNRIWGQVAHKCLKELIPAVGLSSLAFLACNV